MDKSWRLTFSAHPVDYSCHVLQCVSKRIPDTIHCNLKKDDQILMIFGVTIPDTSGHQVIIQVPTSPTSASAVLGKQN